MSEPNANHEDLRVLAERMDEVIRLAEEKTMRWLELSELAG